jgi:hypothetical protein
MSMISSHLKIRTVTREIEKLIFYPKYIDIRQVTSTKPSCIIILVLIIY